MNFAAIQNSTVCSTSCWPIYRHEFGSRCFWMVCFDILESSVHSLVVVVAECLHFGGRYARNTVIFLCRPVVIGWYGGLRLLVWIRIGRKKHFFSSDRGFTFNSFDTFFKSYSATHFFFWFFLVFFCGILHP